MTEREPSLSGIEVNARQEAVAPRLGAASAAASVESVAFAESETHSRFPNQLLIPGKGFAALHEKINIPE